jgi:hypothetical protein
MNKTLPPPVVFLLLIEIATRWRRSVPRTKRLLTQFNVPVYRLSGSNDLYKLADIEAIENASLRKAPKPGNQAWITNNPSKKDWKETATAP